MKKHLLMIVAICLLAVPGEANDLSDELCADEVFVEMVKECERVTLYVRSLNESQRKQYLESEEFACFRENHVINLTYLSTKFNVFERAEGKHAISQALKKMATDPAVCEWYFQIEYFNCMALPDPYERESCIAEAIRRYNQCMGLPPEA